MRYATVDGTAEAGTDYTSASGTLTFEPGDLRETIAVPITDDVGDEEDETLSVTLSAGVNATLAAGGRSAYGTIRDDDEPAQLAIADASLTEGSEVQDMEFAVTLSPASGHAVTVDYGTADGTAVAGTDYTSASGALTFAAGATGRTISVTILRDQVDEEAETFTVTLSNPRGAVLIDASATGTIAADPVAGDPPDENGQPLTLSSLQVTGAGTMYPQFEADIRHYALTCADSTTVQVAAQASRADATLKLLRADSANEQVSTGSLSAQLAVVGDHDIAIELSDADDTVTYVVHCIPDYFPAIKILKKTEGAAEGVLFVTPQVYTSRYNFPHRYLAIIDYNGVPRFTRPSAVQHFNFRPHDDGHVIDGRRIRYSYGSATLLDENFSTIRTISLPSIDWHDFLITGDDTFLLLFYEEAIHPSAGMMDRNGEPLPEFVAVQDGVIREMRFAGTTTTVFEWNSWQHMKLDPDCRLGGSGSDYQDYAHLNSLHVVDGDVVASFKGCNQVLRIDRSSDTGAIEWKIGGTSPPRNSATKFLTIVDDDQVATNDEICGQHHATVTDSGSVLLFDNGDGCFGPRKNQPQFTRVIEFDISSGSQASRRRQYQLPDGQGYADFAGGVTEIDNGNWLITWGRTGGSTVAASALISISEVDPDADPPASVFEMNMSKPPHFVTSYRVYHETEDSVRIPLNLP